MRFLVDQREARPEGPVVRGGDRHREGLRDGGGALLACRQSLVHLGGANNNEKKKNKNEILYNIVNNKHVIVVRVWVPRVAAEHHARVHDDGGARRRLELEGLFVAVLLIVVIVAFVYSLFCYIDLLLYVFMCVIVVFVYLCCCCIV